MGFRRRPVAAGTTDFLVIGFGGIRNIEVEHLTHMGLVNAHPKRIGGHHGTQAFPHPRRLLGRALVGRHPGMVGARSDALLFEAFGPLNCLTAATGVHDLLSIVWPQPLKECVFPLGRDVNAYLNIGSRE